MNVYRVTVVRMVEGTAIVEADSVQDAQWKAILPSNWLDHEERDIVGVEVIGPAEEIT